MDVTVVIAELNDLNPEAHLFENMDAAIVGLGRVAHKDPVAVYSKQKMFAKMTSDGFSQEDAEEYFSKFVGVWAGDNTPVILDDVMEQ